jgi:hypothetical protein
MSRPNDLDRPTSAHTYRHVGILSHVAREHYVGLSADRERDGTWIQPSCSAASR